MQDSTSSPDGNELRRFGLVTGGLSILVFGLSIPWLWGLGLPVWPWIAGALLVITAWLAPRALGPVYRGWMALANVLGWINTRLILGLIYFVVFTPIGLVRRRLMKDGLRRRLEPREESYRIASRSPNPDNMRRPF